MNQKKSTPARGWYLRRKLPHFDAPGTIQHLVLHVFDPARCRLKSMGPKSTLPYKQSQPDKVCLTDPPEIAEIVKEALLFGDPARYFLLEWAIMPTHVHILIQQRQNWSLGNVVQGWKRHTTKCIKALLGRDLLPQWGNQIIVWQPDYWDRYIRGDSDLYRVRQYILENPVKAGLVTKPTDWPWSSANTGWRS